MFKLRAHDISTQSTLPVSSGIATQEQGSLWQWKAGYCRRSRTSSPSTDDNEASDEPQPEELAPCAKVYLSGDYLVKLGPLDWKGRLYGQDDEIFWRFREHELQEEDELTLLEGTHFTISRNSVKFELLAPGKHVITRICANRGMRCRTARTVTEKLTGVIDRVWFQMKDGSEFGGATAARDVIGRLAEKMVSALNCKSQNVAWSDYAVPFMTSAEGVAWIKKQNAIHGPKVFGSVVNPGQIIRPKNEDLPAAIAKKWRSSEAVRAVMSAVLRGIPQQEIFSEGMLDTAFGRAAALQTFEIISLQCVHIYYQLSGMVACGKTAEDFREYLGNPGSSALTSKDTRPGAVTYAFFRALDQKVNKFLTNEEAEQKAARDQKKETNDLAVYFADQFLKLRKNVNSRLQEARTAGKASSKEVETAMKEVLGLVQICQSIVIYVNARVEGIHSTSAVEVEDLRKDMQSKVDDLGTKLEDAKSHWHDLVISTETAVGVQALPDGSEESMPEWLSRLRVSVDSIHSKSASAVAQAVEWTTRSVASAVALMAIRIDWEFKKELEEAEKKQPKSRSLSSSTKKARATVSGR
ncbi:hypothetical protein P389DRAFT_192355 [Cystobasidium minutum MCA 4210]|uniref:uncharacterized protein n=1 Tax=Cystobasidium minutum MCA 4210 TaxID=1397322 RepID=UPI0034CD416C|eukprot:jgi/Rhomi1/192355/gm1.569_g